MPLIPKHNLQPPEPTMRQERTEPDPMRRVDSDLRCGKVRSLNQHLTLEASMPIAAHQSETPTAIGAIFVSLELSRSKWLITSLSPGGGEKMSKHSVDQPKAATVDLMMIPPPGLRRIGRPVAARKSLRSCSAGGTRDQMVLKTSQPCRVFRTALPDTTRCDDRKPISWKYRSACRGLI